MTPGRSRRIGRTPSRSLRDSGLDPSSSGGVGRRGVDVVVLVRGRAAGALRIKRIWPASFWGGVDAGGWRFPGLALLEPGRPQEHNLDPEPHRTHRLPGASAACSSPRASSPPPPRPPSTAPLFPRAGRSCGRSRPTASDRLPPVHPVLKTAPWSSRKRTGASAPARDLCKREVDP